MLLTLDLNDARPLHEQVAAAIRRAIGEGQYAQGDRLPPARDLAAVLGINPNTVLRALRELRDEGLLEFRRGRGVSVAAPADARTLLRERARELLEEARRHGYGREDLIAILEELA
jgi:GntR family transcriptional regulator